MIFDFLVVNMLYCQLLIRLLILGEVVWDRLNCIFGRLMISLFGFVRVEILGEICLLRFRMICVWLRLLVIWVLEIVGIGVFVCKCWI